MVAVAHVAVGPCHAVRLGHQLLVQPAGGGNNAKLLTLGAWIVLMLDAVLLWQVVVLLQLAMVLLHHFFDIWKVAYQSCKC